VGIGSDCVVKDENMLANDDHALMHPPDYSLRVFFTSNVLKSAEMVVMGSGCNINFRVKWFHFLQLGPKRIHTVRTRGGNKKFRALRLDQGNFSWGSECKFVWLQIWSWSLYK